MLSVPSATEVMDIVDVVFIWGIVGFRLFVHVSWCLCVRAFSKAVLPNPFHVMAHNDNGVFPAC